LVEILSDAAGKIKFQIMENKNNGALLMTALSLLFFAAIAFIIIQFMYNGPAENEATNSLGTQLSEKRARGE
jgi:hypothetical protein